MRYVCFPGLGQDADVVWPQASLPFEVVGVDYALPRRGESLRDYARRFHAELVARGVLVDPASTLLAGVSYGAAIAQEIAAAWPCAGVLLLAGIRSNRELPGWLRLVARNAPRIPRVLDPLVDLGAAFAIRRYAHITREEAERCAAMVRRFPLDALREHARMLAEWPGCRYDAPTLRIHGDRDRVVVASRVHDADVWLEGDAHLSSVARADEVNRAIVAFVERVVSARPGRASPARAGA